MENLKNFSEEEFDRATKNLVLMVLHEGAIGQVMHFPPKKEKFAVMQLTIPKTMPIEVMRYVIAHEFGHVMQGRNWREADGGSLEEDADKWAKKWGFPLKSSYKVWMDTDRLITGKYRRDK